MPDTSAGNPGLIPEVITRNEYARQIIAGFRQAMPALADIWDYLEDAINDVLILSTLAGRLKDELDRERLSTANTIAAMRATLAADADSEADPLWYLRDELDAVQARHTAGLGTSGRQR
jgi:hypothetical protein